MIGMPGLAKTMLIRTVAEVLDLEFRRVQFTPDLMPSDITGTDILEIDEASGRKEYRFIRADLHQHPAGRRDQPDAAQDAAALLEAMQEHCVTAAGQTMPLSPPFFVLATQNPLEQEGTYPLPEAQLDRFMFSIYVDYPSEEDEVTIAKVTTRPEKATLRKGARRAGDSGVAAGRAELAYLGPRRAVRDAARARHPAQRSARGGFHPQVGSRRGGGARLAGTSSWRAKAHAVMEGRLVVTSDDVRRAARAHPPSPHVHQLHGPIPKGWTPTRSCRNSSKPCRNPAKRTTRRPRSGRSSHKVLTGSPSRPKLSALNRTRVAKRRVSSRKVWDGSESRSGPYVTTGRWRGGPGLTAAPKNGT